MNDEMRAFGEELAGQLQELADSGPAGPKPEKVIRAVRLRTRRQWIAPLALAAAASIALFFALFSTPLTPRGPQDTGPGGGVKPSPKVERPRLPEPIPRRATHETVEAILMEFFETRKVGDIAFEKNAGEDLSFAIVNGRSHPTEVMAEELDALFQHYEFASVTRRDVELHFSLVAR